ncbi:Basement membrane-specific heparan sulfate proteoglycan core protein [Lamellibrachia satsuma]|nr:Basement membrane-specific heparan sulfate proteoglycan core protein [Lamellibrachia satsuma]
MRRVYPGGVYHSTPSVFECLDDENIRFPESLRYYPYRATFDFDCWFDTARLPSDSDKMLRLFNEKNKDLHHLVKDHVVGGPSLVFHRYHEKGLTTLRQNEYGETARTNCEVQLNICITDNPCLNGGVCEADGNLYVCKCPMGYSGDTCAESASIGSSAGFHGNGYVELPLHLLPHRSSQVEEVIEMTVTTRQPDGLLLWHGQKPNTQGRGKDYLSVAIHAGKVVFSYELGSGPSKISSVDTIDDGHPHTITVRRTGMKGSLEIDGSSFVEGKSGGPLRMLNTRGNMYIGGVPNLDVMTFDQHEKMLEGCISNVYIQGKGPLDLTTDAIGGVNVVPCLT